MTNPANNPWDLGGGGESFPFDHVGDEIEGFIQEMDTRQGSDMQTGELAWWDKEQTRPVMLTILTLQTSLRERPNDDGMRNVTLSGSKKPAPDGGKSRMCAAVTAVRDATGGTEMKFNGWFKMKFVGEGPRTKPGFNPPKYYEAWYRPPAMDLDGQDRTPPAGQMSQPAPGANWPNHQQSSGPEWAQGAQQQVMQDQQQAQAAPQQDTNIRTRPITAAEVAGLSAAGVDPAIVYGADWEGRVVP